MSPKAKTVLLSAAVELYLQSLADRASAATDRPHTQIAYARALRFFQKAVAEREGLDLAHTPAAEVSVDWLNPFLDEIKSYRTRTGAPLAPASEQVYLAAILGFYRFLKVQRLADVDVGHAAALLHQRQRRVPEDERSFKSSDVERVIGWTRERVVAVHRNKSEKLRALRDYAFVLLLADTGLRVAEACRLTKGDLPKGKGRLKLFIRVKGGRQSQVLLTHRALAALRAYLRHRQKLDEQFLQQQAGRPAAERVKADALPLFAQHSPLTEARLRKGAADERPGEEPAAIVLLRRWEVSGAEAMLRTTCAAVFGDEPQPDPYARARVTPHSFRHYYITQVLRRSGGNLKLAQRLARHKDISVTQRYAHVEDQELEEQYRKLFDEGRPAEDEEY